MKILESIVVGGRERLEDFSIFCNHRIIDSGKYPLGPVVRTPHTAEGMSSVPDWELRSCKPCSTSQKKKEKRAKLAFAFS